MNAREGKWVQNYTRRGAPRQGIHSHRWKSADEQREDAMLTIFAIVLAIVGFGALLLKVFI